MCTSSRRPSVEAHRPARGATRERRGAQSDRKARLSPAQRRARRAEQDGAREARPQGRHQGALDDDEGRARRGTRGALAPTRRSDRLGHHLDRAARALGDADPTIYGLPVDGPTIESEIDRLYGLPLTEFTKERDSLARRLRADGRRDDGATIAELRKPVLAAWVVNRLAREQRPDVKALVDAAAEIRAGKPHADDRFRATADELVRAGRETLAGAGRRRDRRRRPRCRDDAPGSGRRGARAAARRALDRAGRGDGLRRDGRSCPSASRSRPAAGRKQPPRPDRARVEEARKALTAARDEARRLGREAEAAEREARRLRADADAAEKDRRRRRGRAREAALALEAEHELALAAPPRHVQRAGDAAKERDDGGVVAAYRCDELGDPRGARVGRELACEHRADARGPDARRRPRTRSRPTCRRARAAPSRRGEGRRSA